MVEYGVAVGGVSGGGYGGSNVSAWIDTITSSPTGLILAGGALALILILLLR